MRYDAVLFDLDGTLIESGPLWDQATRYAIAQSTVAFTEDEYRSLGGVMLHDLLTKKGMDTNAIADVRAMRDAILLPLLREKAAWREGAEELLKYIEDTPSAIVTSSHRIVFEALHETLNIGSYVDTVIIAEDVKPSYKPHPLGLLLASKQLDVDPKKSLYIGDQQCDLDAATAAGMDAILVRGLFTPDSVIHHTMVTHLADIMKLL